LVDLDNYGFPTVLARLLDQSGNFIQLHGRSGILDLVFPGQGKDDRIFFEGFPGDCLWAGDFNTGQGDKGG